MSNQVELKKTLGLTGVTVNAMALIAPGAFLWLTFQMQAVQVKTSGGTTAMDIFPGMVLAIIITFLTAISYSKLAENYPESGTGSSYYFAERSFMNEDSVSLLTRLIKFVVGWFSHLYYWVYPGVMVGMGAILINYIAVQFEVNIPVYAQVIIAVLIAFLTGAVAYMGVRGSTALSLLINIIQITTLVFITVLALIYRFTNPDHVQFVHTNILSVVTPHSFSAVLFQSTIAILLFVGFESATALNAESRSVRNVSRGVILSLALQGVAFYLFEYFGTLAFMNTSYNAYGKTGLEAAGASSAPIGDMVKILGDRLLHNSGFALMILAAASVAISLFGTTLACMNTGIRITYAMAKDNEIPSVFGVLNIKHATPHTAVLVITIVSAVIGGFSVFSVRNLTAVAFISNIGTFILYGMTNLIAFVAFLRRPGRNVITYAIVPVLGMIANLVMLFSVMYLGIKGGGETRDSAFMAIVFSAVWFLIGIIYLIYNSSKTNRRILYDKNIIDI